MSNDLQDEFIPEPITEEERLREAEIDALRIKVTEEDPGYFDRLAGRIIAVARAEGGSIPMEELLGLPASDEKVSSMSERWSVR
jgi:hypothetical protein